MYKGYKIKCFIPSGRERTMSILQNYLMRDSDIVDEVMILRNTTKPDDLKFLDNLCKNPLFKMYTIPDDETFSESPVQHNTGKFYRYMIEEDTIYIRLDDDIVYLHEDFFKNLLDYRIEHPRYFLVFPEIHNNAVISYRQQQEGIIGDDFGFCTPFCMDNVGWANPAFAVYIHEVLLERIRTNTEEEMYIKDLVIKDKSRFSISSFAFFGKTFKKFKGIIEVFAGDSYPAGIYRREIDKVVRTMALDEEIWLTDTYPNRMNLNNAICGNALCSHFSFSPYQKPALLETDILERYKKISQDKLSANYYNLLTDN